MTVAARAARIPAVAFVLWAIFAVMVPRAMPQYAAYDMRLGPGSGCRSGFARSCGESLTVLYEQSLPGLIAEAARRSLVLLVGAAVIARTWGVFLGALAASGRRRALASGAFVAATGFAA